MLSQNILKFFLNKIYWEDPKDVDSIVWLFDITITFSMSPSAFWSSLEETSSFFTENLQIHWLGLLGHIIQQCMYIDKVIFQRMTSHFQNEGLFNSLEVYIYRCLSKRIVDTIICELRVAKLQADFH